jgi:hypothetical protein
MVWNATFLVLGFLASTIAASVDVFLYTATGIDGRGVVTSCQQAVDYFYIANTIVMAWPTIAVILMGKSCISVLDAALARDRERCNSNHEMIQGAVEYACYVIGGLTLGVGNVMLEAYLSRAVGLPATAKMRQARNWNLVVLALLALVGPLLGVTSIALTMVGLVSGDSGATLISWVVLIGAFVIGLNCVLNLCMALRAYFGRGRIPGTQ